MSSARRSLPVIQDAAPAAPSADPAEPPLPTVFDAILDSELFDKLFVDFEALAELMGVVVKTGQTALAPEAVQMHWGDAKHAVLAGAAVQLRYRFDGKEWWDTLMPHVGGVRLVRMEQTFGP